MCALSFGHGGQAIVASTLSKMPMLGWNPDSAFLENSERAYDIQ